MIFSISPADPRPIYLQIMDEVRRAVALKLLRADEVLPSVRQLSSELRVNPNTVQQAYRELERTGLLYVRRGLGTFVANVELEADERRDRGLEMARRVLQEAHRQGLTVDELIDALRQAARSESRPPAAKDTEHS